MISSISSHTRAAQIDLLQLLVGIAAENNLGIPIDVKIKFNIVASLYDYNPNLATYMKVWNCHTEKGLIGWLIFLCRVPFPSHLGSLGSRDVSLSRANVLPVPVDRESLLLQMF